MIEYQELMADAQTLAIVGFVFIVQGAFQTHPIQIALSFTVSVIPSLYLYQFVRLIVAI